jgi:Domain of unknown function (DUF4331)
VSNHFTGLSLGPPLGDQRLDLCDLYAFQSPADPARTVLILNANPNADALHPDAIYRLAVDNDGDLQNDIAFSYVFSTPQDGRQTVDRNATVPASLPNASPQPWPPRLPDPFCIQGRCEPKATALSALSKQRSAIRSAAAPASRRP